MNFFISSRLASDVSEPSRQPKGRVFTRLGRFIPAKSKSIAINLRGSSFDSKRDLKKNVDDTVDDDDDLEARIKRIREKNEAIMRRQREIQKDIELHS